MTDTTRLTDSAPPVHATMLIGGERRDSTHRIHVYNPARPSELVGTIVRGTPEDVNAAVAAAKGAQPSWAACSYTERAETLQKALARLELDVNDRAALFVRENGKTLAEAKRELADVATRASFTLALAAELDTPREIASPDGLTRVRYVPYGVVVSIGPWNAPVSLSCMQIVPALLTGNAVVLKAPESCPLSLIRTAELIAEALPPGLLNIVTGMPSEIGDALTTHADVGKIGFTGSIPSARKIIANAALTIKSVTAELGGNDPAILLPDADLGEASMQRMASIVYRMSGQVCMAIKRIYVPDGIHDAFVEAFIMAVDRIVVGDGLDPAVTMGPLHTRAGLERGRDILADAVQRGARVKALGQVRDSDGFEHGYFMRPTVVTEIDDGARLMREEQFCPAVPIVRYHGIHEAIARANATEFGLGGSIWSRDVKAAMALAGRIEAGTVFVNTHGTNSVNRKAPYGGLKQSGAGRRAGIEGLQEYMQLQTLTTYEP
jgi:aldehyde dehydrogenase